MRRWINITWKLHTWNRQIDRHGEFIHWEQRPVELWPLCLVEGYLQKKEDILPKLEKPNSSIGIDANPARRHGQWVTFRRLSDHNVRVLAWNSFLALGVKLFSCNELRSYVSSIGVKLFSCTCGLAWTYVFFYTPTKTFSQDFWSKTSCRTVWCLIGFRLSVVPKKEKRS